MSEIFDIVTALNNLKDHMTSLIARVDRLSDTIAELSKHSPLVGLSGLMDEAAAAKYLHLSCRELRRIRSNGEIRFKKVRRKILYDVEQIKAYLQNSSG